MIFLFHFDDLSWWHVKISILSHPFRRFFHDNEVTIGYPWISTIYNYIYNMFTIYFHAIFPPYFHYMLDPFSDASTPQRALLNPFTRPSRWTVWLFGCFTASWAENDGFWIWDPWGFQPKMMPKKSVFHADGTYLIRHIDIWLIHGLMLLNIPYTEHMDMMIYDDMTYLETWFGKSHLFNCPSNLFRETVVDDPRKRLGIEIRHAKNTPTVGPPVQNRAIDSRRHCSTICTDTWQIGISGRGMMGGLGPELPKLR